MQVPDRLHSLEAAKQPIHESEMIMLEEMWKHLGALVGREVLRRGLFALKDRPHYNWHLKFKGNTVYLPQKGAYSPLKKQKKKYQLAFAVGVQIMYPSWFDVNGCSITRPYYQTFDDSAAYKSACLAAGGHLEEEPGRCMFPPEACGQGYAFNDTQNDTQKWCVPTASIEVPTSSCPIPLAPPSTSSKFTEMPETHQNMYIALWNWCYFGSPRFQGEHRELVNAGAAAMKQDKVAPDPTLDPAAEQDKVAPDPTLDPAAEINKTLLKFAIGLWILRPFWFDAHGCNINPILNSNYSTGRSAEYYALGEWNTACTNPTRLGGAMSSNEAKCRFPTESCGPFYRHDPEDRTCILDGGILRAFTPGSYLPTEERPGY